ncbi:MAG: S8 family peptidase [Casimicrobiaceae bacterium]
MLAAVAAVFVLPLRAGAAAVEINDGSEAPTQRLIVKFRDGATATRQRLSASGRVAALSGESGVTLRSVRTMALGAHVVALDSAVPLREARAIARRLAASADVEYAEPDRRVHPKLIPNDPRFAQQTYLGNAANAIAAVGAWDITTGSTNTVVAVLDSGYRPHVDLADRILPGYDFIGDIPTANDGDGRDPDASDPGDWVTQADIDGPFRGEGCSVENSSWHGTNTASIIAADSNNGSYITGINWSARVLPVRVLGKCGGFDSDIADAIVWASGGNVPGVPTNAHPAQIINLSLAGEGACLVTSQAAINAALANGTRAIVAAAGNETANVSNSEPANCLGVIAVAASNSQGNRASYSNFGAQVTISAPGGDPRVIANDFIYVLDNSGTTVPVADSTAQIAGTSAATPVVSGVISLMLAVAPNLTAAQVRSVLTSSAHAFPMGSTCTTTTCGAGIVNAQAAVLAAQALAGGGGSAANYQGLWWATGGVESGWGINFAHQGETIFATWFTYDASGSAWWLSMTATKTANGIYSGTLYRTSGPAFNAMPFDQSQVTRTAVGTGTLTFTGPRTGTFGYTVNSVTQVKSIELQVFGPVPTCVWGAQADLTTATNYQDLWWAASGQESGWGINLTHQGTSIFATWFTYDANHNPLWYSVTAAQTAAATYTGSLIRTSGPAFNSVPFDSSAVQRATVGTATLTFSNGNSGNFTYQVLDGGISATQTKPITRQVFVAPGTVCH